MDMVIVCCFFFSSRRRHTICALVTGFQTCALPIYGEIEAALVQADVADWAFRSTALFAGRPAHDRLRFLAHLYSEAMHVVVRRAAGIRRFADLRGRERKSVV